MQSISDTFLVSSFLINLNLTHVGHRIRTVRTILEGHHPRTYLPNLMNFCLTVSDPLSETKWPLAATLDLHRNYLNNFVRRKPQEHSYQVLSTPALVSEEMWFKEITLWKPKMAAGGYVGLSDRYSLINFGKAPPKEHLYRVFWNPALWFLRRCCKCWR